MLTLLAALFVTCGVPPTLIPPPKPLAVQVRQAELNASIKRTLAEADKAVARARALIAEIKEQQQAYAESKRPLGDIVKAAEAAERERLGRVKD